MPVMDGMIATREIRKEQRFKGLPIIAFTANFTQQDIENPRSWHERPYRKTDQS